MSKKEEQPDRLKQFISWVDGDREPKDRTLFVMEQRPHREFRPSEEEFERREKDRLRKFFNWYPIAAAVICMALGIILFTTVMNMPGFGQEDNPINNEVAERYLEHSEEETGSENVVTAMIIGYRGFDTLGESCVLFLAVSAVMILLLRDRKNTSEHELQQMEREETAVQGRSDLILKQVAWVLLPFIFLFAIYVLLNGETSPGGGFSGGTILGAGLILFSAAFGPGHTRVLMNQRRYSAVRTFGLLLYAVLYGVYIFIGANGTRERNQEVLCSIEPAVGAIINRPPRISLTPLGRIVDETIRAIPDHYPGISVDQYIIMPDHVHLILALRHIGPDERQIAAPTPLSNVIQQMKRITSK